MEGQAVILSFLTLVGYLLLADLRRSQLSSLWPLARSAPTIRYHWSVLFNSPRGGGFGGISTGRFSSISGGGFNSISGGRLENGIDGGFDRNTQVAGYRSDWPVLSQVRRYPLSTATSIGRRPYRCTSLKSDSKLDFPVQIKGGLGMSISFSFWTV